VDGGVDASSSSINLEFCMLVGELAVPSLCVCGLFIAQLAMSHSLLFPCDCILVFSHFACAYIIGFVMLPPDNTVFVINGLGTINVLQVAKKIELLLSLIRIKQILC
jgi:hypothetical protein